MGRLAGKATFVPYTLPGEQVRVEIVEEHHSYSRGRLLEVLAPSPDRVEPPCPHFGRCGGCHWQHISYPAQLRWKEEVLRQQLRRIGGIAEAPLEAMLGMEVPWGYRNTMRFAVSPQGELELKAWHTAEVVPLAECSIINQPLSELFQSLEIELPGLKSITLRGSERTGESLVILEIDEDEPPFLEVTLPCSCLAQLPDGRRVTLVGNDFLTEKLGRRSLRISAGSFFQANTLQAERLAEALLEYLKPTGSEVVLDAYSGVGTFGLLLSPFVARVVGIESNPEAVADARHNASGSERVEFLQGTVEEIAPTLKAEFSIALVDPPRQGCTPRALEALIALSPEIIACISSDPATLARDLKALLGAGYQLERAKLVDMFPQTYHIESLSILRRATG